MSDLELLALTEVSGLTHGSVAGRYSPPLNPEMFPDAAEAYRTAYFHALAYVAPWPGDQPTVS